MGPLSFKKKKRKNIIINAEEQHERTGTQNTAKITLVRAEVTTAETSHIQKCNEKNNAPPVNRDKRSHFTVAHIVVSLPSLLPPLLTSIIVQFSYHMEI